MRHHIDDMTLTLLAAIRRVVELAPCSTRSLALQAGIDPSLLTRILSEERAITPEIARKIEVALLAWRDRCAEAAELLRRANNQHKG
jgi:hypothetical protein